MHDHDHGPCLYHAVEQEQEARSLHHYFPKFRHQNLSPLGKNSVSVNEMERGSTLIPCTAGSLGGGNSGLGLGEGSSDCCKNRGQRIGVMHSPNFLFPRFLKVSLGAILAIFHIANVFLVG